MPQELSASQVENARRPRPHLHLSPGYFLSLSKLPAHLISKSAFDFFFYGDILYISFYKCK